MHPTPHEVAQRLADILAARSGGLFLAVLVYAAASVAFIPVTLLATVTLAVFGAWPGIAIAWMGGLLGANLSHALGRLVGPRLVAWLPRGADKHLRRFVTRRPISSALLMRLAPVGNFGAFNLVAGAAGLPAKSFLVGNAVGLLPGLLGLGLVVDRVLATLRNPGPRNVAITIGAVALVGVTFLVAKRRVLPGRLESHMAEQPSENVARADSHKMLE
jgi:uncharacterized membrane protein YdjX (TVP38/TMEM64 family)